jgi:hypothetical protein
MPKSTPTEWLLARLTTTDRATAILGDLTEMAAARGRLWFWTAYARTLITLGWRAPVAFVLAIASLYYVWIALALLTYRPHPHWSEPALFHSWNLCFVLWVTGLSASFARWLIFALPFVIVRFGFRNRLTQVTFVLFLVAMPGAFSRSPWLTDWSGVLTATVIVGALITPRWRRPMIVMAAASALAIFITDPEIVITLPFFLHLHTFHVLISAAQLRAMYFVELGFYGAIGFALPAILCLYLSRRLLRDRPAIV